MNVGMMMGMVDGRGTNTRVIQEPPCYPAKPLLNDFIQVNAEIK